MVAITGTSLSIPQVSTGPDKAQVAQARRDADAAQSRADELRAAADQADRSARTSQDTADTLNQRSKQMDATYAQQLRRTGQTKGLIINVSA